MKTVSDFAREQYSFVQESRSILFDYCKLFGHRILYVRIIRLAIVEAFGICSCIPLIPINTGLPVSLYKKILLVWNTTISKAWMKLKNCLPV